MQFYLQVQRQLGDFIQEEHPAICRLEQARPVAPDVDQPIVDVGVERLRGDDAREVVDAGARAEVAAIRAAQLGLKTACVDAALGKDGKEMKMMEINAARKGK